MYSTSNSGSREVLVTSRSRPLARATAIAPEAMAEKYGSSTSWMTNPTMSVAARASA
jgi:hypothetical protein